MPKRQLMNGEGTRDRNAKFLPAWVILAMAIAVSLVTCQIAPKQAAVDANKASAANPANDKAPPGKAPEASKAPGT